MFIQCVICKGLPVILAYFHGCLDMGLLPNGALTVLNKPKQVKFASDWGGKGKQKTKTQLVKSELLYKMGEFSHGCKKQMTDINQNNL